MSATPKTHDERKQPWRAIGKFTESQQSDGQALATEKQQAGVEGSKNLGEHPMKHMFVRLVAPFSLCFERHFSVSYLLITNSRDSCAVKPTVVARTPL